MSSQDEDVAAILGLPSARFVPKTQGRGLRRVVGRFRVVGAFGLALFAGALSLTALHITPFAQQQKALRPSAAQPASMPAARPATAAIASIALQAGGESGKPATSPAPVIETLAEPELPPPPPPPSAQTLADLRAANAPPRVIASVPKDTMKTTQVERLTTSKSAPPDVEEPAPEPVSSAWLAEPSGEEVASAYPPDALRDGAPGSVVMSCIERVDGRVRDCRVLDERPFGVGFGRAALRLSRRFRFSPVLVDGRPVEAEVRIPYDFSVVD